GSGECACLPSGVEAARRAVGGSPRNDSWGSTCRILGLSSAGSTSITGSAAPGGVGVKPRLGDWGGGRRGAGNPRRCRRPREPALQPEDQRRLCLFERGRGDGLGVTKWPLGSSARCGGH